MKPKLIINLAICLTLFTVSTGSCASLKEELFKLRNPQATSEKANKQQTIVKQDGAIKLTSTTELDLTISGEPMATEGQCVKYLISKNPFPLITVSPEELVKIFYEESAREKIRGDAVFSQSLHETGNFAFGGDVIPFQNNFAGIGTTGGGVKGAYFETVREGVRAQVQHLKAYSSTEPPTTPIVDPRYELVKKLPHFGTLKTWQSLNGKWAVPGKTYGQMILAIHQKILKME